MRPEFAAALRLIAKWLLGRRRAAAQLGRSEALRAALNRTLVASIGPVASSALRAAKVKVIYVTVAFRPGYPEVADSNVSFSSVSQAGDAFTQDHPATQVHASLTPLDGEPVILNGGVTITIDCDK